jgi:quinohemoprotein ethanol dehydrogenase
VGHTVLNWVELFKRESVSLVLAAIFCVMLSQSAIAEEIPSLAPAFSSEQLMTERLEWITNGGNLYNQRYSPLTQITKENVSTLKGVWRTHLNGSGIGPQFSGEAQPIMYKGVIYIITGANDVFALSVKTGEILWQYQANLDKNLSTACCGWASRGVTIGDGRVYIGQLDGKMVALEQDTGKVVWSVQAEKWEEGYTITSAPLYFEGLVITGFSGAEKTTRGRVKAFDAKTGNLVWTFYTIPAPGEPGHETWPTASDMWKYGGGSVWMTPAVDPALGLIYFGTSNPGSDFNGSIREGNNLYANSMVALDIKTGRYVWHFQTVHHDLWDYAMANPVVLFDVKLKGKQRRAIAAAGKTGWVYILDRKTGKPLLGIDERQVPQDERQKTARTQPHPVGDSFVPQSISIAPEGFKLTSGGRIFTPFWTDKVVMKPSSIGGANWPPSSVDPVSSRMFVCANDKMHVFAGGDKGYPPWIPGQHFTGASGVRQIDTNTGIFSAIDLKTNKLIWQQRWRDMCYSGSAVTASNLIFVGRGDGRMTALDADDGTLLWEFRTDAGINAPPTVVSYEGRQYVIVLSAGNLIAGSVRGDSVWMFGLDGELKPVEVPKLVATSGASDESHEAKATKAVAAPSKLADADVVQATELYVRACSSCHGKDGEGTGNGMSLTGSIDSTANAQTILFGRKEMPAFGDLLTPTEIQQLSAYVSQVLTKSKEQRPSVVAQNSTPESLADVKIPEALTVPEREAAGEVYARACASCHGVRGEGVGLVRALYGAKDAAVNADIVRSGAREMPAFAGLLTPVEIAHLAVFVTKLRPMKP